MRKCQVSVALAALIVAVSLITSCSRQPVQHARAQALGGDVEKGREALFRYGCGGCHTIPGVTHATGLSGPPLNDVGTRWYIAGILPNTPANMALWIREPQRINPKTTKPSVSVPDDAVRNMVAYLYRQDE